jgi:Zn-dependent peptidase ImmA (M78 family)
LGHFYIPDHREILLKGKADYSLEGFSHKNVVERQADAFAATLLIPMKRLKERMGRRGFLSLSQILALAEDC